MGERRATRNRWQQIEEIKPDERVQGHQGPMRSAKPTERPIRVDEAEQNGTEIPHETPSQLGQPDRRRLPKMAYETCAAEVWPRPRNTHLVTRHIHAKHSHPSHRC